MDMQGSRTLNVTQQQAWEALNDPEVLKVCIPGCDKIEKTGDDQYAVSMAVKIGPVSAKFNGKIALSDIVAPQSYTIGFDGQGGAAGHGKGTAKVNLTPADDPAQGCLLAYTVNAQVGGKIAQLGQRLIDGAAKSMADDFFKRFHHEMERRYPDVAVVATVAAGSHIGPDAAKNVAGKVQPTGGSGSNSSKTGGGFPVWLWAVIAFAIAAAIWFARGA
ncbi:MAG: carbon monoxide dehydrogenase subunit G [Burkholderiales bacterium]